MPVVIIPGAHVPKKHPAIQSANSPDELLKQSCPELYQEGLTRIVATSFDIGEVQRGEVYPSSSSFVRSAIEAWGRHSHLVLRPDDIWFTILVQMNFFVGKNAESLRHIFVPHEGKKALHVEDVTWFGVVDSFRRELQKEIKTPWMSDWISPGFSTSTVDDERTATILMMGLMKDFFEYSGSIICGIPSITLLGTLQDWERLVQKIDRFEEFGDEPKEYARRLHPILTRMVSSFANPSTAEAQDFWNEIVQAKVKHSSMCGVPPIEYVVSGWILGFFYWDKIGDVRPPFRRQSMSSISYDGVQYGTAPLGKLPVGYAKAEFIMTNNHGGDSSKPFHGWVLAGSIGQRIIDGAPEGYDTAISTKEEVAVDRAANALKVQAVNVDPAETRVDELSHMTVFFQSLSSFGRMLSPREASARTAETQNLSEKPRSESGLRQASRQDGHSIIQPMSGWFLFGPSCDVDSSEGDELNGPTVDAIDSCKNTEHLR